MCSLISNIFSGSPNGFHLRDVSVRPARPDERTRWDRLMDQHHHLGFKRFAGREIRYVFEWRGHWAGCSHAKRHFQFLTPSKEF